MVVSANRPTAVQVTPLDMFKDAWEFATYRYIQF